MRVRATDDLPRETAVHQQTAKIHLSVSLAYNFNTKSSYQFSTELLQLKRSRQKKE